ncbi:hypothetical protein O3M35_007550 [Rhynocoris fuscipes]|uniref:RRP15-like protein n=1 Tax=Rhynocoris fuscipes TaxID=488301 RepID=A0AAW1DCD5_9HEMI
MKLKNTDNETIIEENKLSSTNIAKQKEIFMKGRLKPNVLEKDKEKRLQKITVKGVVKLFNAVNKHQQNNNKVDNSGPVMTKKEKIMNSVSKSSFLNYLMGDIKEEKETEDNDNEVKMEFKEEEDETEMEQQQQNSTWEVLQSNYGIGVKLKNWDNKPTEEIDIM